MKFDQKIQKKESIINQYNFDEEPSTTDKNSVELIFRLPVSG